MSSWLPPVLVALPAFAAGVLAASGAGRSRRRTVPAPAPHVAAAGTERLDVEPVTDVREDERARLAARLHDGPQQTMTSVALILDACLDTLVDGDWAETRRLLTLARTRNREALRDLRSLSSTSDPATLSGPGLAGALALLAARLAEAHGIRFRVELGPADELPPERLAILYQILREATTNAVKHGRPSEIRMLGRHDEQGALVVTVQDDGVGMVRDVAADGLGQGLDAMRGRARALGGTVAWGPAPGGGTQVRVVVPADVQLPRAA